MGKKFHNDFRKKKNTSMQNRNVKNAFIHKTTIIIKGLLSHLGF